MTSFPSGYAGHRAIPLQALGGSHGGPGSSLAQALSGAALQPGSIFSIGTLDPAAIQAFIQTGTLFTTEPAPPPVENAGIKVGEILGWRIWRIEHSWLYSMTADYEWVPGEVVKAHKIGPEFGSGIHAFKQRRAAANYSNHDRCAVGQIKMWGEVIEFERGYHAEYAAVHSIDLIVRPWADNWFCLRRDRNILRDLRRRYKVPA